MSERQSPSWDELLEGRTASESNDDVLRVLAGERPTYGMPPLPADDDVTAVERWAVQERLNDAVRALSESLVRSESSHAHRVNAMVGEMYSTTEGSPLYRYAETARKVQAVADMRNEGTRR